MWVALILVAVLAWQFAVPLRIKTAIAGTRVSHNLIIAGSALLASFALLRGNWIGGLVGTVVALAVLYTRPSAAAVLPVTTEPEARAILGIEPAATAADVQAAWRRLIAQVHPDHGGTADLARRVTAARDLLLKRLETR